MYLGDIGSKGKQPGKFNVIRFPEPSIDPTWRNQTSDAKDVVNITFDYHESSIFDFETMFMGPQQPSPEGYGWSSH